MMGIMDLAGAGLELVLMSAIAALPLFLVVAIVTLAGRKRFAPWFRHALWSLVLIRLALPVSIGSSFSLQAAWQRLTASGDLTPADIAALSHQVDEVQTLPSPSLEPALMSLAETPNPVLASAQPISPVVTLVDWMWGLTFLSLVLGSVVLGIWTVATTIRLRNRLRRGEIVADAATLNLVAEGCRAFAIRRPVTVARLPRWGSPATVGIRRPQILLPEDAAQWTRSELRHVVWHELAHIRRYDAAWNVLLAVVRCLHWWNPMFWWAQRSWLAERELACDALVVERIGRDGAADYGRTLVNFVERLGCSRVWNPVSMVPRLVSLLGEKATIRRRLKALAAPAVRDSVSRRRLAGVALILLAFAGLTDAAPRAARVNVTSSITLPEGATWGEGLTRGVPTTETVTYDLETAIERIRRDEPELSERIVAKTLQQEVYSHAGGGEFAPRPMDEPDAHGPVVLVANRELVVQATAEQHRQIREILDCRCRHGWRQIVIETCWVSTPGELTDLFPGGGGEIVGPAYGLSRSEAANIGGSVQVESLYSVPAYVRVMKAGSVDCTQLARFPRLNVIFAPKVTTFEGQTTSVAMGQVLPFVTGFVDRGSEGRVATVTKCPFGTELNVTARYDDAGQRANLRIAYRQSEVVDVEFLKLRMGMKAEEVAIQVPHLSGSLVDLAISLTDGETVLVAPLRRDKDGHLRIGLITPRLLKLAVGK